MASAAVNNQINALAPTTLRDSGFTGGGQIGVNYQAGMFVGGAELDLEYTRLNPNRTFTYLGVVAPPTPNTISQSAEGGWLATVRARGGIAIDRLLFYGTGGLALARVSYNDSEVFSSNGQVFAASSSETKAGWVAGGGIEWAIAKGWSVKGEYLRVDLGTTSYVSVGSINPNNTIEHRHRLTEDIARVGVNYKVY